MRILVSEYVCGGGWNSGTRPESLVREGGAMLTAIVRDLASLPDVEVLTTWDQTVGESPFHGVPQVTCESVSSPEEEHRRISSLADIANVGLVIAPEFGGLLKQRCRDLREMQLPLLNAAPGALQLCADKLELYRRLESQRIPTIPTEPIGPALPWPKCVVKLRDGAGSTDMSLVTAPEQFARRLGEVPRERYVVQPFIPGRNLSIAGLFQRGRLIKLLPVAEQRLSDDGTFQYRGGIVPAPGIAAGVLDAIAELIEATVAAVDGLHGYIGFDLLLTGAPQTRPVLVEINPRLTTSWIGYRDLFGPALVRALCQLHGEVSAGEMTILIPKTENCRIHFQADGTSRQVHA